MKRCSACGMLKEHAEFLTKPKRGKTVLRGRCIECYDRRVRENSIDGMPGGGTCTTCGKWKPLSGFYKQRIWLYGREPVCKECKARKRRERVAKYPEQARSVDLKAKYGITLGDYEAMHARQQGRCTICETAGK